MNRRSLFKLAFGAAAYPVLKPLEKLVPKKFDFVEELSKCNICQPIDPARMLACTYNVRYIIGSPPPAIYLKRIQVPENSDDLSSTLPVL